MEDKRCILPRGRGVGGSSIINFMMYVRGHKNDYDRWAAAGNDGWSWKDVLPYFLKSERSAIENLQDRPFHSRKGDLSVEHNQFKTPLGKAFVEACKYLGQSEIDYNSGESLGVSYVQANTLNGSRHTAFGAFIKPILNRPNLHIMINTRVTKILIDPQTKTAFGVEFIRNGKTVQVNATKEVILSAGTFHSPQLLMLSGIGTQKDLAKMKIPIIHELPVGKFLSDHFAHYGPTMILNSTGSSLSMPDIFTMQYVYDYFQHRGPLTSIGAIEALSFIKTKLGSSRGSDMPDIELVGLAGGVHSDYSVATQRLGLKSEIFEVMHRPLLKQKMDTFTVVVMLFHPKSTGFIELRDTNPLSPPKIYTNYLKNPDDVENILEGIKFVVRLINTPIYQKLGAYLHSTPLPSCAHIHFGSDDYWRCSIRTIGSTLHHQVGTCKMGLESDETAVVSPRLIVHGIHKLRVVDTSVIPESPTGHTNAPSFMIGEKAADLIKEDWN